MDLRQSMELDFRNMLQAGLAVDCMYTPKGTELQLPVKALVSATPPLPEQRIDASPRTAFAARGTSIEIEVPSLITGEQAGATPHVGALGGVTVLQAGDSFTIDGQYLSRASGDVVIKIGSRVERFPGRWVGGGAL